MKNASTDLKGNADSARYALLRRLQPAMRHQMAGGFQPVTMLAAILEKRLQGATPHLTALGKTSADIRALSTAATRSSLDLIGWIAPDPAAKVPLEKGILDALHLVATELSIRGFKCVNQTGGVGDEVLVQRLRGVFVAGLLALTDAAVAPMSVLITAGREGHAMVLTIALTKDPEAPATSTFERDFRVNLPIYRKMEWCDVDAMALADGISLKHGPSSLVLHLPIAAS